MILAAGGKIPSQPIVVVVVTLILLVVSLSIARRQGRIERDPRLVTLLMAALLLHFFGAAAPDLRRQPRLPRRRRLQPVRAPGGLVARNLRSFSFTTHGTGIKSPVGDGSVSIAAGVVFALVGTNELAAFFVFGWLSWLGTICFYRAFCLTFPEGGHRRYALMLFLLPSLLYWTSDASKEAVVMLALGVATLGSGRVSSSEGPGLPAHRPGHGHGRRHPA